MDYLERLARLMNVVPNDEYNAARLDDDFQSGMQFSKNCLDVLSSSWHSIKQVQEKRDDLSGKPKEWVNDWARWRGQNSSGNWYEFSLPPIKGNNAWIYVLSVQASLVSPGEVLSDWRDTLEERVVEDKAVEWVDGLPPVGAVCDLYWPTHKDPNVTITYQGDGVGCYKNEHGSEFTYDTNCVGFRPIKTPKEKVIEEMNHIVSEAFDNGDRSLFNILYDAGYRIIKE